MPINLYLRVPACCAPILTDKIRIDWDWIFPILKDLGGTDNEFFDIHPKLVLKLAPFI
jgi:hypothetical protein